MCIVGRQSGKSRIAGLIADFEALRGTSGTYAMVVAQDLRGALRAVSSYARQPFRDLDAFRAEITSSFEASASLSCPLHRDAS